MFRFIHAKLMGIARTTFWGAMGNSEDTHVSLDKMGRQVMWPYQIRELTTTGSTTIVRALESVVIPAIAGAFVDVVTITASNTSGAAQTIDIRNGTATTIIDTLVVPATNVVSKTYHVPLLASEQSAIWTAQNSTGGELSDNPVSITMVGIQNK